MKKIIIFKYGDGELANQLWNYISVYAYGLENNIPVYNPSFYEYHSSFKLLKKEFWFTKILAKFFTNYAGRKQNSWKKVWRNIYKLYTLYIEIIKKDQIISSDNLSNIVTLLPPSKDNQNLKNKESLDEIYFNGWLFRNPLGLQKYRKQILLDFSPKYDIIKKVESIRSSLLTKYEKIIGVHFRQGDYLTFKGGRYLISEKRVLEIINEYVTKNNLDISKTVFLITSDGPINPNTFKNLNIYISKENAVTDLFLLSATDTIIGSDSSFGHFSSWYGNIPHIVMNSNPIDWDYYSRHKEYFENKYCTMVHF